MRYIVFLSWIASRLGKSNTIVGLRFQFVIIINVGVNVMEILKSRFKKDHIKHIFYPYLDAVAAAWCFIFNSYVK